MNHKALQEGVGVKHNGKQAILLRRTWAQYAWIVYEGDANPQTVLASELVIVLEDVEGRRWEVDQQS